MANGNGNNRAQQSAQEYEYQRRINELRKANNNLAASYGRVLNEQLQKEGRLTNTIRARVDLAQDINDIKNSETSNSEKSLRINEKIAAIEKKQLENNKKYFGKNREIALQKNKQLNTDKKLLKVERDRLDAIGDATDLQQMQAMKMFSMLETMTTKFKKIPGGGMILEAIGLGEKNMGKFRDNFVEFAQGSRKLKDLFKIQGTGGSTQMATTLSGMSVSMGKMVASAGIFVATIGIAVGLFTIMFKIAKAFSETTDKLGKAFGVMGTNLQNKVVGNLRASRAEAAMLGFGIEDLVSTTTILSDEFGIGFENASSMSLAILDSSMAMGLTVDEGSKLFGILMGNRGLSLEQAEALAESTYQMAQQNNVNPSAVMRDIANSAEIIAKFGGENLENITKTAVQAKKLGLNLSDVDQIASSLLNFQSSLNAEIEASILLGKNLNFQRARELALTGQLDKMMENIVQQLGGITEFDKLNVLQKQAIADSIGTQVHVMERLARAQDASTKEGKSFVDLLGKDGMSALTEMLNKIKALGVVFIEKAGPAIMGIVDRIMDWLNSGGFDSLIAGAETLANVMISIVENLGAIMGALGAIGGAALGFMVAGPGGAVVGGLGGALGGYSMGSNLQGSPSTPPPQPKVISVRDFKTSGGSHLVLTPRGRILKTDSRDTLFGTTNQVNDFVSGPAGSLSMGGVNGVEIGTMFKEAIRPLVEENRKIREQNENLVLETRRIGSRTAEALEDMM